MSGYSGRLKKDLYVLHREKRKKVLDWYFTSDDGCHNSDLIVIKFSDGSDTGDEGFSHISYPD